MQHKVYCDNHCLRRQICHTKYTGVLTSIGLYIFISLKRGSSCLLTLCHLIPIVPAKHQKNQLFCVCGIAHYRYHMRDTVHICLFASGYFCSKYFQSSTVSSQRKIIFPFKGWIVSHWDAYTAFGFTMHLLMSILFFGCRENVLLRTQRKYISFIPCVQRYWEILWYLKNFEESSNHFLRFLYHCAFLPVID